jgi:uncharacterized protein YbjQ (UPF0145 family)
MMLMTTTPTIEGRSVKTYLGIVGGEAVVHIEFFDANPEKHTHDAREAALAQMSARAQKLGASAVVGVSFDLEALHAKRMLVATGTAVVL